MASSGLDAVIMEHSAVLVVNQLLSAEEYKDLYREQYFKLDEATVAELQIVLDHDPDNRVSITDDLEPIRLMKLQQFAWRFTQKIPEKLN